MITDALRAGLNLFHEVNPGPFLLFIDKRERVVQVATLPACRGATFYTYIVRLPRCMVQRGE